MPNVVKKKNKSKRRAVRPSIKKRHKNNSVSPSFSSEGVTRAEPTALTVTVPFDEKGDYEKSGKVQDEIKQEKFSNGSGQTGDKLSLDQPKMPADRISGQSECGATELALGALPQRTDASEKKSDASPNTGQISEQGEREGGAPSGFAGGGGDASPYDGSAHEMIELLGFLLGQEEYAIPVSQIKEIIRPLELTAIPRSSPMLMGIISLRGVIIPVFNLKSKLAGIQSEHRSNPMESKDQPEIQGIDVASKASEKGGLHPALPVGGAHVGTGKCQQASARVRDGEHPGPTQAPTNDALKRIVIVQIDQGILGLWVDGVTDVVRIQEREVKPSPPLFNMEGQDMIRGITRYKNRLMILLFIPRIIGVIKEEIQQLGKG